ncbi:hypothetical protein CC80DRAFT_577032 [Byssothecium circinans]|uniref:RING-type domain-containing protein n=1 Tax=Byssothecium circinans TaxID=147558 RepID=A0A6A5TFB6_9PLEO|nr:hypothetical protein CC80DRAFT_577032 [Byssothecium circinans]
MAAQPKSYHTFRATQVHNTIAEDTECSLCCEEYDDSTHQALRIDVPPCTHVLCTHCFDELVSRRTLQLEANKCPFCRVVWFLSEYNPLSRLSLRAPVAGLAAPHFGAPPLVSSPGLFQNSQWSRQYRAVRQRLQHLESDRPQARRQENESHPSPFSVSGSVNTSLLGRLPGDYPYAQGAGNGSPPIVQQDWNAEIDQLIRARQSQLERVSETGRPELPTTNANYHGDQLASPGAFQFTAQEEEQIQARAAQIGAGRTPFVNKHVAEQVRRGRRLIAESDILLARRQPLPPPARIPEHIPERTPAARIYEDIHRILNADRSTMARQQARGNFGRPPTPRPNLEQLLGGREQLDTTTDRSVDAVASLNEPPRLRQQSQVQENHAPTASASALTPQQSSSDREPTATVGETDALLDDVEARLHGENAPPSPPAGVRTQDERSIGLIEPSRPPPRFPNLFSWAEHRIIAPEGRPREYAEDPQAEPPFNTHEDWDLEYTLWISPPARLKTMIRELTRQASEQAHVNRQQEARIAELEATIAHIHSLSRAQTGQPDIRFGGPETVLLPTAPAVPARPRPYDGVLENRLGERAPYAPWRPTSDEERRYLDTPCGGAARRVAEDRGRQ